MFTAVKFHFDVLPVVIKQTLSLLEVIDAVCKQISETGKFESNFTEAGQPFDWLANLGRQLSYLVSI